MLGRDGEDLAGEIYRGAGFEIVARNFRADRVEIDLIARRGDLVVFCEVKTRGSDRWGVPAEAVDHRKQARIRRAAGAWLAHTNPGRVEVRFDVVSVIVRDGSPEITHLPGAF